MQCSGQSTARFDHNARSHGPPAPLVGQICRARDASSLITLGYALVFEPLKRHGRSERQARGTENNRRLDGSDRSVPTDASQPWIWERGSGIVQVHSHHKLPIGCS